MARDPLTAFGLLVLALFRRRPRPVAAADVPAAQPGDTIDDQMAALKRELEAQIDRDLAREANDA